MFLVTGGAGFIGSNIVASLNEAGHGDVAVCDVLGRDRKWRNLAKRQLADFVPPAELAAWLGGRKLDAVIHMGAISDTTADDADLVMETNFRLSLRLLDWCTASRTPFIYASSAATYGGGEQGFVDDNALAALRKLEPMNLYGWSKHLFDLALIDRVARGQPLPPQWAGLKFFNVYGPNEYHKGRMASVVLHKFGQIMTGAPATLFRSDREGIADGEQLRDFVHVDDCVAVVLWLLQNPQVSGLFNVGTGTARSFLDLTRAIYAALGRTPEIAFVDMPVDLVGKYQYFTEARMDRLRAAGFNGTAISLEDGVGRYVQDYLMQSDRYR